jgi:hypothetical protein
MTGRVDQVQLEFLAGATRVRHAHGIQLDRDATFALQVQRVQHLALHLALLQRPGHLDQAIGERGLPVVDVGHDTEIADTVERRHEAGAGAESGGAATSLNLAQPYTPPSF